MLSVPDMAIAGVVALLLFGPDQLPKVARKAGSFMRDIQNTSHAFIREMERAADEPETHEAAAEASPPTVESAPEAPPGTTSEPSQPAP